MRNLAKGTVTLSSAAAIGLIAARAHAQAADVEPPLPNVLLLVDTSGSMEKTVAGGEPTCIPLSPVTEDQKSRWTKLVEALTGPIQDFSCYAHDRTSSSFIQEYTYGGEPPYDRNYHIPFHRLLSAGCTAGPGPGNTLRWHYYNDATVDCPTPWAQTQTGLLDVYRDRIRFSLMTFDTLPDARTGLSGGVPDPVGGMRGMWSYFENFQGGGTPAQGHPVACEAQVMEVGARNPAAPLWEGPLIPFPEPNAPLAEVHATNERIQSALIALRPYGATPLAGMLEDARTYLMDDDSYWEGRPLGPRGDDFFRGGCRKSAIVLISDGEPNLDLRPSCAQGPGVGSAGDGTGCPYSEPHEIAHTLNSHPNPTLRVRTFTVGFGLSAEAGTDCSTIAQSDFLAGGRCDGATGALKACCTLARIAIEGGTDHGYFPDDANQLSAVMSRIFAEIAANSTSRTLPVFATATTTVDTGSEAQGVAYRFASSFTPPPDGSLWTGNLERRRYTCDTVDGALTPVLEDVDRDRGDDFAANVNDGEGARPRRFFTVIGAPDAASRIHSQRSIRPPAADNDGLGSYGGTVTGSGEPQPASFFASELGNVPRALDLDPSLPGVPPQCSGGLQANDASLCARRIIEWTTGEEMPGGIPSRDGREFGSIYHSTPVVIGPPTVLTPDESFALFADQQAEQPLMLYTATTDGQLHAFQVTAATAEDDLKVDEVENNELWSFFPPHVLPRLLPTFNQQAILLDGAPVVKHVVFERTAAQAEAGNAEWRTVLVASGRGGGSFYYALDVTNPKRPEFLWQLSTDDSSPPNALFGELTPTPAIAMIELRDGLEVKEVAVAILAGGMTQLDTSQPACDRKNQDTPPLFNPTGNLSVRDQVRCWGPNHHSNGVVGPSRSLTIVRLDTGEVIRTFRGHQDEAPPGLVAANRVTVVDFDSPISGVPVAYPSQTGQIADRVYVGDADGTLWRVNLSSANPNEWTVDLAWDAYALPGDTAARSQPIETVPVVSLDALGNKVVLFSTGDQESFTSSGSIYTRVWSITEKPDEDGVYRFTENWVVPLENGKRVTGPISLFDGCAYFATFTPEPNTYACADGFGSLWGVDYLRGNGTTPAPYPEPCLPVDVDQDADGVRNGEAPEAPGTIIFGVAVMQAPACVDTEEYNDPHFGSRSRIRQATPTQYQLVYHTGAVGMREPGDGETRVTTVNLPPPRKTARVSSWAHIIE